MFIFSDYTFLLLIPPLALAIWAQMRVKGTFKKFSKVRSQSGLTGAQVARQILNTHGLHDVQVEPVAGELSDHYDPRTKTVRLSEPIFYSDSISALGIAAHEVGHAIQHDHSYAFLQFRHALLGPANLGSTLAFPLFFVGFLFSSFSWLMTLGIIFFCGALAFQLVTLPVEFDASRRALKNLSSTGLMAESEISQARKVLSAAALTYVAAALMALMQLIRLLILRNARD